MAAWWRHNMAKTAYVYVGERMAIVNLNGNGNGNGGVTNGKYGTMASSDIIGGRGCFFY